MASAENPRQPIPPAVRRRLQAWFESGSKAMASGNFDYATQSFSQCVKGDPANALYIQNFLGNLAKKYNNNKSGAGKIASLTKGASSKTQLKKANMQKDWPNVIEQGIEAL